MPLKKILPPPQGRIRICPIQTIGGAESLNIQCVFVHMTYLKLFYSCLKSSFNYYILRNSVQDIHFKRFKSYLFLFQERCKDSFTLNAVNMTGTNEPLHNQKSFCFKPWFKNCWYINGKQLLSLAQFS